MEITGATALGAKSQWCLKRLKIMGYLCTPDDKELETKKILKIINWPMPINLIETRVFLGIYIYYYIWITRFAVITAPLYILF